MTGSIIDDIKHQIRYGNMAVRLMLICISVFLLLGLTNLVFWIIQRQDLFATVLSWLSLPISLTGFLHKPWTIITFMFTHYTIGHIVGNMIWLYAFGNIFLVLMPRNKTLLGLFVAGSIIGALFATAFIYLLPPLRPYIGSPMVGASAGIMAIVFAAATLSPYYKINLILIGEVSIVYVALASFVLDLVVIPYGNAGGMLAHIGGALFGYGYVKLLRAGTDFFAPFYNIIPFIKNLGKHRLTVSHKQKSTPVPSASQSKSEQDRLDEILDKMNRSGYDSLSKEEKEFLFQYSNRK
jgi:membrane associated rhomboid family serine protease